MNNILLKRTLFESLEGAGRLMTRAISQKKVITKKGAVDLVTQTDHAAERLIIRTIRNAFPSHAFLAEESNASGNSTSRWIIDPIDGTTNFAHGLPAASVSIAYEEHGVVKLGGVYDPFRKELFHAELGKGAFLNGKRIRVSKTKLLEDALLATGFPYNRRKDPDKYLRVFREFLMQAQEIRRFGSAAIDLCYVACGRFDGYWEAVLNPWDKAAGMLIVKEAGGKLSGYSGKPATLDEPSIVVSNGLIHPSMITILK